MSVFSGPQQKGAMREHRKIKREEAESRQSAVSHKKTKAHRLGRCTEHGVRTSRAKKKGTK